MSHGDQAGRRERLAHAFRPERRSWGNKRKRVPRSSKKQASTPAQSTSQHLVASLHVPVASLFDTNVLRLKSTLDSNNAKTTMVTAAAKGTVVATSMEAVAVRLRRSRLSTLQATTWPRACASCAAEGEPNEFREPTRGQPISLLVWNLGLCRPPYRRNGSGDTRGGALLVWGIRHHGGCCGLLSTSGSVDGVRARRVSRVKRAANGNFNFESPEPLYARWLLR